MVHFQGTSYKSHTSCMTEAQKYEGALYKDKERKGKAQSTNKTATMIPRKAYVEDEQDTEMGDVAVAVIDVPPRAPSPPNNEGLPPGINVYDFLVKEDGASQSSSAAVSRPVSHMLETQASTISDDSHFRDHGYSYGDAPLHPGLDRYGSFSSLQPHAGSQGIDSRDNSQQYLTPGPNSRERRERDRDRDGDRDDRKSDKKRKRHHMDELDILRARQTELESSGSRPQLHSGLTGGLSRLLARPVEEFEKQVRLAQSPLSPVKRSRKEDGEERRRKDDAGERTRDGRNRGEHRRTAAETEQQRRKEDRERRRRRGSSSSDDDRKPPHGKPKAIEFHKPSLDVAANKGQLIQYRNPAEHFLSFINKGPESERGMSINKALKRYHRERGAESDREKDINDKLLWKELRLRRNERGEIVLFSVESA